MIVKNVIQTKKADLNAKWNENEISNEIKYLIDTKDYNADDYEKKKCNIFLLSFLKVISTTKTIFLS